MQANCSMHASQSAHDLVGVLIQALGHLQSFGDVIVDIVLALERNHPANSARDRALIDRIAGEQGLFLTGGSDFHGLYEKSPLGVGACLSEQSGAERVTGATGAGRESA